MLETKNKLDGILNKYYLSRWRIADEVVKKYDIKIIDEFLKYNSGYVGEHCLNCNDIEIFLKVQEIFKNRTEATKKVNQGDILEIHSNNGYIFHKNAHIEKCSYNDTGWTYCESASPHFNIKNESFSTSGGAWGELDVSKLECIGQRVKTVWTWGSCGATGNGGIYIPVLVNVFKLKTDRKFVNFVVNRLRQSDYGYKYEFKAWNKNNCSFHCYQSCFRTMTGLKNFLKNRGLKLGETLHKGYSKEVDGDFDYIQHMDKKEYDTERGELKEFPLLDNGSYTGAFLKNNEVHFCNCNVKDRAKMECFYK